jgi:hypothetical protein
MVKGLGECYVLSHSPLEKVCYHRIFMGLVPKKNRAQCEVEIALAKTAAIPWLNFVMFVHV